MSSSPAMRPPPKPPPPNKVKLLKGTNVLASPRSSRQKHLEAAPSPSDLVATPSTQATRYWYKLSIRRCVVAAAFVGSFLCRLFSSLGWAKIALEVFDENPQKSLTYWNNIVCADPYEADTNVNILFAYQLAFEQGFNLDKS